MEYGLLKGEKLRKVDIDWKFICETSVPLNFSYNHTLTSMFNNLEERGWKLHSVLNEKEFIFVKEEISKECKHSRLSDELYLSSPPKRKCLDCGSFIKVPESKPSINSKLADAFLAIRDHGWELREVIEGKKILVPPEDDERRTWTAIWDEDGLPHWLPKFSEGEK
ncbi:hypothetical protein Q7A53_05190 [Halobacillus rhizosphaerae]|uniref:hypothetical protein n=1 Tax=Halobacillus rhizosphaerae TaxID=3064889 RepID=UPI00398AD80C